MDLKQLNNLKKAVSELSCDYTIQFHTKNEVCVPISKDVVEINMINNNAIWEMTTIKLPKKKPITAEYLLERVAKLNNRVYVNHRETFAKLNEKLGLGLTPNSYGLGIESIFHSHKSMHDKGDEIKAILDSHGIEYTISVSDASWVYRLQISKKESNINRINKIIND